MSSLERRFQIDCIYTYFRKAFDRVVHSVLIKKLQAYGIFGALLQWFGDYLLDRVQIVKINNVLSNEIKVTSGLPQGGHLSPLLFNLYVNDIQYSVVHTQMLSHSPMLQLRIV